MAFYPLIQVLQPISPLAWMPLALFIIQDSEASAIFVIFICSIWPMLINTAFGVAGVRAMMTKENVTMLIFSARTQAGLTWEQIAEKIDMSPVWTHSAGMGMNGFPKDKAETLVTALALPQEAAGVLEEPLTKVWEQSVPTDPCIDRFHEIVGVYGPTLKALIEEKFGTGIMSAIDFEMSVQRVENPKGDRVKIKMSGKYLACNSW